MSDEIKNSAKIETLELRLDNVEKRFDKLDDSMEKMWQKVDQYREGQIITQTLLSETRKDVQETRLEIAKVYEKVSENKQNIVGKWETFWSKGFWYLLGLAGTITLALLLAKMGVK